MAVQITKNDCYWDLGVIELGGMTWKTVGGRAHVPMKVVAQAVLAIV
jgi:hypothetical protein